MKKILLALFIFINAFSLAYSQCTKPSVVSISNPSVSPYAICQGASLTLSGNVTVTGSSQNGGFTYSWIKGPSVLVPPTAITIPANAPTNVPSFSGITGLLTDAGTYTLRIEDGNTGNSACYTEASVIITVTSPVIGGIIGSSQTTCQGSVPVALTQIVSATGGSGVYTYTWQKSTTSTSSGFTIIPGATNSSYNLPVVTGPTTYYRRIDASGACAPAPTNPVTITVNPIPSINVSISSNITVGCAGNPVVFTATVSGTGATPAPTYEWFITSNSTATGGVSQGAPSTTANTFNTANLTATNNKVYVQVVSNAACAQTTPVVSNLSSISISNGIGAGTIGNDQTICYNTVPALITELSPPTSIFGIPSYTWEASATGSGAWTTIPGSGSSYTFPAVGLTQDVYIRRAITDPGTPAPCNIATSNVVHITVRPLLTPGIIGSDEALCSGAVPATITHVASPIGGTGTYAYQWQSDQSGIFTNIPGATSVSYTPGALTATTRFQRIETSGSCGSVTSNVVTKTITAAEGVTAVIDNPPTQVCSGPQAIVFTAAGSSTTGNGTIHYTWELGGVAVGTDSPTYTYSPVSASDNGKVLKVTVRTSNTCNTGSSSATYTLDIVSSATPTVTLYGNSIQCVGLPTTFTATSTGGGSGATYQWYVVPSGSPASTIGTAVGTGGTTFTSTSLLNGDRVYVTLTSTLGCISGPNPFKSNEITMVVKPIPAPVINESDQTVCTPNVFIYTGNVSAGNVYQWTVNGTTIPGATNSAYTASQTGVYSIREDNGICTVTSDPVQFTSIPVPLANAGPDQYALENSLVTLNASGGDAYAWTPSAGFSSPNISNPTVTISETTTFIVTVSDAAHMCSSQDAVTIYVVLPGAFSTAIMGPNPITPGQQNAVYSVVNQAGFSYVWSVTGGTIISGQNTNSVTVDWDATNAFARTTTASPSISVVEKNTHNQTKKTTATINTLTTGVMQTQVQAGIKLFPNPTSGTFSIEMPETGMDVTYEILDLTGASVASGSFTSTGSDQTIDANFGAGMYQVILKYNNIVTCARLSKVQ